MAQYSFHNSQKPPNQACISAQQGTVSIVKLVFCDNISCEFSVERHLLIQYDKVIIASGNAVAISYTWGEFDRQSRVLGHDVAGRKIEMNLGQEWVVDELTATLVKLSAQFDGCWIDQICIPQNEADIRRTLALIPEIYRSFEVVALMPVPPCRCLGPAVEDFIQSFRPSSSSAEKRQAMDRWTVATTDCVNSFGLNSWFDRIWTRQEFMYSRRISIVRTRSAPEVCVKSEEEISQLNRFAKKLLAQRLQLGSPLKEAFRELKAANTQFGANAAKTLEGYCSLDNRDFYAGADVSIVLARFMSGEVVENQQPPPQHLNNWGRMVSFIHQLGQLGTSTRKASRLRDYVTSIWVDCPGYVIPADYRTLGIASLLEDAILQMERNTETSLAVSCPAGLFGDVEGGAFWRPTRYMSELKIQSARDIYSVIFAPFDPLPVSKDGAMPILSIGYNSMSVSSRANSYRRTFDNHSTAEVLTALQQVVNYWPEDILFKVTQWQVLEQNPAIALIPSGDHLLPLIFERWILSKAIPLLGKPGPDRTWGNLPEVDHHAIFYGLVTRALGLEEATCQALGLELMISLEQPPCVGLMKPEVSQKVAVADFNERTRLETGPNPTICLLKGHRNTGLPLIECSIYQRTPPPIVLDVVGVWVPTTCTPLHDVQGYARPLATDSRIGGRYPVVEEEQNPEADTAEVISWIQSDFVMPKPPSQVQRNRVDSKWHYIYFVLVPVCIVVLLVVVSLTLDILADDTAASRGSCHVTRKYWTPRSRPLWYSGPDAYHSDDY